VSKNEYFRIDFSSIIFDSPKSKESPVFGTSGFNIVWKPETEIKEY
jgi:hypothetical protein